MRAGIRNFSHLRWLSRIVGFGFLNVHVAIFSFTRRRTKMMCHRPYGRCVQQLFFFFNLPQLMEQIFLVCASLLWVKNTLTAIFRFSMSFRWCHQSTWPAVGCSSYSSYLWSFASHLLDLCDRSLGQNAQPRVLLPTSWSLLVTGAHRLSQSNIHFSDPLHSGPNS